MDDLLPITLQDMIIEARRELALRQAVYARLTGAGRMSVSAAGRRIALMQAIIATLEKANE